MDIPRAGRMLVFVTCSFIGAGCVAENEAAPVVDVGIAGDDRNGEYLPVADWWKPAPNHDAMVGWGDVSGVSAIDPDRVFVVVWGDKNAAGEIQEPRENQIVVANRNGEIIEVWSQWDSILHTPHHVYVDPYDPAMPVWVVERGSNGPRMQLLKFSNDGTELLLRIGGSTVPPSMEAARSNPNPGPYEFGQPAALAFFPNGDVLLADGYWHCRLVRFNAQGEYLSEFGECGDGPGQLDVIHGVAIDRDRRIYVADRSNNRIQVFEEDGTHVAVWPDIASPADVWVDADNSVWVAGRTTNRMLKYDTDGRLQYYWGTYGGTSGGFDGGAGGFHRPHQISVDREGNFYVADWDASRVGKHIPRPGADRGKLIGPQMLLTMAN